MDRAPTAQHVERHECRQCCAFCDRMVQVSHCLDSRCQFLYFYDEEEGGRRYMGCMNKVFGVEIDFGLFHEAERTRLGFGGVKLTGKALPQCRTTVERAYDGHSPAFDCVNPEFYEPADAVFDLRDF